MIGLLTWTAYGTWLPGAARGRVDLGANDASCALPAPDVTVSRHRRRSLKWPPVLLDEVQRRLVLSDLHRIAGLRRFEPLVAAVAADRVHLLMSIDETDQRPTSRLVQLIKGSLSRTLSTAAGDPPALTEGGDPLPHHKWWSSQYSFRAIADSSRVTAVRRDLLALPASLYAVRGEWTT